MKASLLILLSCFAGGDAFAAPSPRTILASTSLSVESAPRRVTSSSYVNNKEWSPDSWRNGNSEPGQTEELENVIEELNNKAPLVFAGEVRRLHEQLARVSHGQGFVLMGGDDALEDAVDFKVDQIRDTFQVIMQMALVMTFGSAKPVVKVGIGRMAGDLFVNNKSQQPADAGTDDPNSMIDAYQHSAQTLNILRAFSTGGFADMSRLHAWNLDFVEATDEGSRYRKLSATVDESLRFMNAIGIDTRGAGFSRVDFFAAHECASLPYEQAFTRMDSLTGRWYDCSSHMICMGEDSSSSADDGDVVGSRQCEFTRGIGNPLSVRISEDCTPEKLLEIIETMNPMNIPGKLSIIVRMGTEQLQENLPGLIRAVLTRGKSIVWIIDPTGSGTGDFDTIRSELRTFFDVHESMGSHPGGVRLEMTGEDVVEYVGGSVSAADSDELRVEMDTAKGRNPRLNGSQALELAFLIAEGMRRRSGMPPL
eukprot:CAMPEP_0183717878 /NCGR_PEP_ID=MMETSP0737-20130205/11321_1 /TAXON_ID=385413 /ORGANISM="Thalassiosira miniscula, Strain CCMP1093" /LENGTH=479 /DNA_ID=CAMNT_0025947355 /DNA_START=60 /DNA_END=1499 /DNA_ORIENTATION=+